MQQRHLSAAIAIALGCAVASNHAAAAPQANAQAEVKPASSRLKSSEPPPESVTNLETIKVTARRYQETLQDVPIAVTAFTSRALFDQNVQDLSDLQGMVPNLQIGPTQGTSSTLTVYLRGIGQNNPLWGFDPEVGLYLDGVYIARPQGALLDVFDVDRIEVLRGPQGTLYGKNSVGGAINFISRPLPTHETGSVTTTLGMHGEKDVTADYGNASADGVWRMRVAAATLHNDGYGHDLVTGSANSNQNTNAARVSVGFFPSTRFNAQLEIDGSSDHSNPRGGQRLAVIPFDPNQTPPLPNPWNTQSDQPPVNLSNSGGGALTMRYVANENWEFKSITAYRGSNSNMNIDVDTLPVSIADNNLVYHSHQFSQELQALYDNGSDLHGVMGLYWFDGYAAGVNKYALLALPPYTTLGYSLYVSSGGSVDTHSLAGYADYTWAFAPRWSLEAGARYTHESKTAIIQNYTYPDATFTTPNGVQANFEGSTAANNLSPKLTLGWKASDAVNLYATASTGFHSGGYNIQANCTAIPESCRPIRNETLLNYELGAKMSFFDGRLMLNSALFHELYHNIQLSVYTSYVQPNGQRGFFGDFTNAGKATIDGMENEFAWRMGEHWTLSGNLSYLHPRYTQYLSGGVNIAAASKFTYAPKWNGGLTLWKHFPLAGGGDVAARLNITYQTLAYFDQNLSTALAQGAYGLVNAGVIWRTGGPWTWSLEGSNLADKHYRTSGFNIIALGMITGYYGPPRMVTVSARYLF